MKFSISIIVVLTLTSVIGCSKTDERIGQLEARLARMDTTISRIDTMSTALFRAGLVLYTLSDIERNSTPVGSILSSHTFTRGDRLFIGEDMWDVMYVKGFRARAWLFGQPVDVVNKIELLVKFGGKAGAPKSSEK